jgi:hypothetical protein
MEIHALIRLRCEVLSAGLTSFSLHGTMNNRTMKHINLLYYQVLYRQINQTHVSEWCQTGPGFVHQFIFLIKTAVLTMTWLILLLRGRLADTQVNNSQSWLTETACTYTGKYWTGSCERGNGLWGSEGGRECVEYLIDYWLCA